MKKKKDNKKKAKKFLDEFTSFENYEKSDDRTKIDILWYHLKTK